MSDVQTQQTASKAPMVRVLVVDDSAVTREVLTALLNSDPEIRVIGQASTGAEAVELTATLRPDGDGTHVKVDTELTVTGRVAQFGRGVLADVSSKLLGQFVDLRIRFRQPAEVRRVHQLLRARLDRREHRLGADGVDHRVVTGDTIFIPARYPHGVKADREFGHPFLFLAVGYPHKHVQAQDRMRLVREPDARG